MLRDNLGCVQIAQVALFSSVLINKLPKCINISCILPDMPISMIMML